MAARIAEDLPGYEPVLQMAIHARYLDYQVEKNPEDSELRMTAVTAHDKVACYLTPKLKSIDHTLNGAPLLVQLVQSDGDL